MPLGRMHLQGRLVRQASNLVQQGGQDWLGMQGRLVQQGGLGLQGNVFGQSRVGRQGQ